MSVPKPAKTDIIDSKDLILKGLIGNGRYSSVFYGKYKEKNYEVAVKLEKHLKRKKQHSLYEYKVYKKLVKDSELAIPKIIRFGTFQDSHVLIMERLGPTLEELLKFCQRKFSANTILHLADQMIKILELVHENGFIHRDVSPDNFLMGVRDQQGKVHIIDFGSAMKFKNSKTNDHVPKEIKNYQGIGKIEFRSTNAHDGFQSRRDDLISLGYVLIYFFNGSLPWSEACKKFHSLKPDDVEYEKTKKDIYDKKLNFSIPTICEGHSELTGGFKKFFKMLKDKYLKYDGTPDYDYLRRIFENLRSVTESKYGSKFDWERKDTL